MAIRVSTVASLSIPNAPAAAAPSAYRDAIARALSTRRTVLAGTLAELGAQTAALAAVADRLVGTLRGGHKVLVAGNGGSAAEAQHFTAELVGRFKRERDPYAVLALTADTTLLTAVANDYGYADVFARQVRALGQRGDLLLLYSTSGESENVVRAAADARPRGVAVVAVTGARPSRLAAVADTVVRVPIVDTAVAQELHMLVTHVLCDVAEAALAGAR
jgi:D-sedoheptulose 7-phosphate isomerase